MRSNRTLWQSAGLRLVGLGLVALSAFAVIHLHYMEHNGPVHEGISAEFLVAAVAFFAASSGIALFALGIHFPKRSRFLRGGRRRVNHDLTDAQISVLSDR